MTDTSTRNVDDMGDDDRNASTETLLKKVSIYRFKFTDEVMDAISQFSKIHQYDDRHAYKEAWDEWIDSNDAMVCTEVRRLQELGCDKDIHDKMFKAGRYYFRKKSNTKKPAVKRREYIPVSQDILDAMDRHIRTNLEKELYTPAWGYDDFCETSRDLLASVINTLVKDYTIRGPELANKIKKTYKNRYYVITRNTEHSTSEHSTSEHSASEHSANYKQNTDSN